MELFGNEFMDENFKYLLSKQPEWAEIYKKEKAKIKLQKNRDEKKRNKEKFSKS